MRVLFILLALLAPLALQAQSVVYEQQLKRFATAEGPAYKPLLSMFKQPAKISYQYTLTVRITQGANPGQYQLALYAEPGQIGGSRKLDGFDVSKQLWPDSMSVFVAIDQPGGASVVGRSFEEPLGAFKEGIKQNLQTNVDWTKVRLSLRINRIMFSGKQIGELEAVRTQIGRYAFVTGNMAALPADLKRFEKVDDPDTLDARRREITFLEAAIPDVRAMIEAKPFWLTEQDIRTTESLLADNSQLISELKAKLDGQAAGIKKLVKDKAGKLFRTAKRQAALPYYRRLVALDPADDQAIDRLTLLTVEAKDVVPAVRLLIANAGLMQGFAHQRTVDKAGRALEVMVVQQMKGSDPEAARPNVFLMDSLCKRFPGYRCPNLSFTKQATPVRDAYAKLMNRARVETSQDKLDVALTTIDEALKTAQEGGLPIANQQTAMSLQRQVAERYISKQCYMAQTAYRRGQDSLGTEHLVVAADLAKRFSLPVPDMYKALRTGKAEPYVVKLAQSTGESGMEVTARKNASRYIAAFGFDFSPKVAKTTASTTKNLQNNDCKRTQSEINELVAKGLKAEKELAFASSKTVYSKALDLSRRKPECLINNAFLLEKLQSVDKPALYQNLLEKAEEHLEDKRYDSAFTTYSLANRVYEDNGLAARFLVSVSVPAVVRNSRYAGFALYAGERFLGLNELDSALAMAHVSVQGKPGKDALKAFQENLALKLAERDRKAGPRAEPRQLAVQYSRGDKRLKEFEKAYLAGWNIQ